MFEQKSERTGYFRRSGKWVRGTQVKSKYYGQNLVVDKNDKRTRARFKGTQMAGRRSVSGEGDTTMGIKLQNSGWNVGRTKSLSRPYPSSYPILKRVGTQKSGRPIYKVKRAPVKNWGGRK